VKTGHWPLFRYDPRRVEEGLNPLLLDSPKPSLSYYEFIKNEPRFRGLLREMDDNGAEVQAYYDNELRKRYAQYEHMAADGDIKPDAKKP